MESAIAGIPSAAPTNPTAAGDPVTFKVKKPKATSCIQAPSERGELPIR
jgi:hypothetical protein